MEPIAEALVALLLGGFLTAGAVVTHQQEKLCAAMGGTFAPQPYTTFPYPPNVCSGGNWLNLFRNAPRPTPHG